MTSSRSLNDIVDRLRDLREQFVEITEPHRPALWRYCLHLTGSPWEAEDLVQETIMRAFARLSNFWQPLSSPRSYLFRIASNTWIDTLRRGKAALDPLEEARHVPAERDLSRIEVSEAMVRLITLLPPRQRAVVLLVDVFDFTGPEAAAMLGATEGAVRAALHRARTTLRRARSPQNDLKAVSATRSVPADAVVARFVDAFNRRDADAIVALLAEEASTDIVGVAEEHGREIIRDQSLREGLASPQPQRAEPGVLAGEPVVFIFTQLPDGREALMWMIRLGVVGETICTWKAYFFTPELIRYAADALGVPAVDAGYRYVGPENDQPAETP